MTESIVEVIKQERQRCADICEACYWTNDSAAVARKDILSGKVVDIVALRAKAIQKYQDNFLETEWTN